MKSMIISKTAVNKFLTFEVTLFFRKLEKYVNLDGVH